MSPIHHPGSVTTGSRFQIFIVVWALRSTRSVWRTDRRPRPRPRCFEIRSCPRPVRPTFGSPRSGSPPPTLGAGCRDTARRSLWRAGEAEPSPPLHFGISRARDRTLLGSTPLARPIGPTAADRPLLRLVGFGSGPCP